MLILKKLCIKPPIVFPTYMLALTILDILVLKYPASGIAGIILWIAGWIGMLMLGAVVAVMLIKTMASEKLFLTSIVLLTLIGGIVWGSFNPAFISGEGTVETGCFLRELSNGLSSGYGSLCHLGYPARQFALPSLPSLIFGRSLPTLQIGHALYFYIGILLFTYGSIKFMMPSSTIDPLVALILGSFLHFPLLTKQLFLYEQASYPFDFSLITMGSWLLFMQTQQTPFLLAQIFLLHASAYAYTPSLSLIPVQIFLLAASLWKAKFRKRETIFYIIFIFISAIPIIPSVMTRQDIRIIRPPNAMIFESVTDWLVYTANNLMTIGIQSFVTPLFISIFAGIVILSISGAISFSHLLGGLWIIGVIASAVLMKGFSMGTIQFLLLRATVIIPIFVVMLSAILKRTTVPRYALYVTVCFVFVSGIWYQSKYLLSVKSEGQVELSTMLQNLSLRTPGLTEKNIYFSADVQKYAKVDNLNDILAYFLPDKKSTLLNPMDQVNLDSCTIRKGIFVTLNSNPCRHLFIDAAKVNIYYLTEFRNVPAIQPLNFSDSLSIFYISPIQKCQIQ